MNRVLPQKIHINKFWLKLAVLFSLLAVAIPDISKATHIMGSDLTYECLGPNQYLVRLKLFRDCNGINPNFSYPVNYSSATCGVNASVNVVRQGTPQDITPLCPGLNSECAGGSGSSPYGVQEWIYEGVLNLPAGCGDDWVISWQRCCRNNAVTTLNNPGNNTFYVATSLDNTQVLCNSSPEFLTSPTPFTCINEVFNYNHGVVDPDGDSLVFSLGSCMQNPTTTVQYLAGYGPTSELSTTGPITINSITGDISFTPNMVQVGVMCVLVEEYRNGVKIGEVVRDMQITVLNCTNSPPEALGVDSSTSFNITVCEGEQFCFDIVTQDLDGDNVTLNWNNGIPSGQFVIDTSVSPPTAVFCWLPDSNDVGTHFFTVTLQDDHCPIIGTNIFSYIINVSDNKHPPIYAGQDRSICTGDTVHMSLKGLTSSVDSVKWTDGLKVWTVASGIVKPRVSKSYLGIAYYDDGCVQTDTRNIDVKPSPFLAAFPFNSYICPGGSVQLNAITNSTSTVSWTPAAGLSCTNCLNPVATPASSTVYQVTATDTNGCGSRRVKLNVSNNPPLNVPTCNVVYATPNGTGGGSQADPTNLRDAIRQAQCNNTVIRMSTGIYSIDTAITNITSFTTLEGGFNPVTWEKTSLAGATTIYRTNNNVEDTLVAPRLVAIYMNSAVAFKFQDITIEVQDAPVFGNLGISTYGVHLTNCSNYEFTRVKVLAGDASQGANGISGLNGSAGQDGYDGTDGLTIPGGPPSYGGDGGTFLPVPPEPGAAPEQPGTCSMFSILGCSGGGGGMPTLAGSNGGNGGTGGGPIGPAGAGGTGGGNGGDGASGINGMSGLNGSGGPAGVHGSGIFTPFQAGNGSDGTGGYGGAGGGAGSFLVSELQKSGGGGGGGGSAGTGGAGGYGGGSSYGVFIYQNGPGGNFTQCEISAGNFGAGGTGGGGGTGGAGGAGGSGATSGSGGNGGDGGDGGNGGSGGNGGNAADGISNDVIVVSGNALTTSDIKFNLTTQPVVLVENVSCTNSGVNFTSLAGAGNWTFPADATPGTGFGNSILASFDSTGRKTIRFNNGTSHDYAGFANIAIDGSDLIPDITSTANPLGGDSFYVCQGDLVNFMGIVASGDTFHWDLNGAIAPSIYRGASYQTLTNLPMNNVGVFTITLRVFNSCCGWSDRDTITLYVDDQPNLSFSGNPNICFGDSSLIVLSGASTYSWTPFSGISTNTGDSVYVSPVANTIYNIIGLSSNGFCSDNLNLNVAVNDFTLSVITSNSDCNNTGASSANVLGTGPFTYLWSDSQTTKVAINLAPGPYTVTVTQTATGCQKAETGIVGADSLVYPYVLSSGPPTCFGDGDGYGVIDASGGAPPYDYAWSNGTMVNYDSALIDGTYMITVTDRNGCLDSVQLDISQPDSMYIDTFLLRHATCPNRADGEIDIFIDGGTGSFNLSWDDPASQDSTHAVNLAVGTYTIVAVDLNGCTTSDTFDIISPPALNLSSSITHVICYGDSSGQIAINTTGGSAPYFYNWSNGDTSATITNLIAGVYSVTVSDTNLCLDSILNITVNQGPPFVLDTLVVNANCFGANDASIDVTVSGAIAPYTYNWSNGATTQDISGIGAGLYDLTVQDLFGCTDSLLISITEPTALVIDTTSVIHASCNGSNDGAIDILISGGVSPYSYMWSGGATSEDTSMLTAGLYSLTVTDSNGCQDSIIVRITEPAILNTDSVSVTQITCNGASNGDIDISTSGGTLPYTFNWSNGSTSEDISSLSPGFYTLTVTDNNGCQDSITISIVQPAVLDIDTQSIIHLSCFNSNDGQIDLITTGGNGSNGYIWSDGATTEDRVNLTAGLYSVTVSDLKGCSDSIIISIVEPNILFADTVAVNDVSCFSGSNGSINANISGGSLPYSYDWSNNSTSEDLNSLSAGLYVLVVTDINGCEDSLSVNISQPALLNVDTVAVVTVTCNGLSNGSIDVLATGGVAPYSYLWSSGDTTEDISSLNSGLYTLSITDNNGCRDSIIVNISDPSIVVVDTLAIKHLDCFNDSSGSIDIAVTGGLPPYGYLWSNSMTSQDLSGIGAGLYTITVTDDNNCGDSISVRINEPILLNTDTVSYNNVSCFGGTDGSIDILTTGGNSPYAFNWNDAFTSEDRNLLSAALYSLTVTDDNGCQDSVSILITEPAFLVFDTVSVTHVSCNGGNNGSITTSTTGGTAPYSYNWNDSATTSNRIGLTSGSYAVSVTDANGCQQVLTFTINEPASLLIDTVSVTHVSCNGGSDGSIDLSVSGSNGTYSYLWSDGNTNQDRINLLSGSYSVTVVDILGCMDSFSVQINEPSIMYIDTVLLDHVSCFGGNDGRITVTGMGGTPPYAYDWPFDFVQVAQRTNLSIGTYFVVVTDSRGCLDSMNIQVVEPLIVQIDTNLLQHPICVNDSSGVIDISVSGGVSPYNYFWSNGSLNQDISGLQAGSYSVIVSDNNSCTSSSTFVLYDPSDISITVNSVSHVNCFNGNDGMIDVSVSGGSGPYIFSWSNGASSEDINTLTTGTYTVTATDIFGCSKVRSINVNQPLELLVDTISMGKVTCTGGSNGIIDINVSGGVPAYSYLWSDSSTSGDRSGMQVGNYYVVATDNNGCSDTLNINVEQIDSLDPVFVGFSAPSCFGYNDGSIDLEVNG
ncbi:MAG: hypothetical protein HKN22_05705, partial [Bacteroidia bacterium]|nr:hypothetical protein [Bacteroidia bacterium]